MAQTYGNTIIATGASSNASEVITRIKSELIASSWTLSSTATYTSPNGATPISVTFTSTTLGAGGVLELVLGTAGNTITRYVTSGNTSLNNSWVGLEYSISDTHFYIGLMGPTAGVSGALDASKGSPKTSILITTYQPYFTSNNVTSRQWAVGACFASTVPAQTIATLPTANAKVWYPNPTTGTIESAELLTMRPAVQDQTAIGDLPNNKSYGDGEFLWPFVINSDTLGLVGRLNNVFFGSENYYISPGDSSTSIQNRSSVLINGLRYSRSLPSYYPTTQASPNLWYSPFGTSYNLATTANGVPAGPADATVDITSAPGGPNIYIKRGDGS